jgi:ABC-2 type transport system permease protein
MSRSLSNIYRLGRKELFSLWSDPVLVFLIVYAFSFAVYEVTKSAGTEVENAAVAIVDEDRSPLSRRIHDALLTPYFHAPAMLEVHQIDEVMESARYTFVIDIPPNFQADVLAGARPAIQVNVDATAMSVAGRGAAYIQSIIGEEIRRYLNTPPAEDPVGLVVRARFNPNLESAWFQSVMEIINNITLLAIILTGAALIREREHGTVEHLLVMPLRPAEIMIAKVWSNGLVIVCAATLSLWIVVQGFLDVPIVGSIPLFLLGAVAYLFSATALGILLATLARSMPQFGLLAIPVFIVMNLLSGGQTPLDSMPQWLQTTMQFSPSTHFVSFAQAVLYRDAGLDLVWRQFAAIAALGVVFFLTALVRFRTTVSLTQQ